MRRILRGTAWAAGALLVLAVIEQAGERFVPLPPLSAATTGLRRNTSGSDGTSVSFTMKPTTPVLMWRLVDGYRDELGVPPGDELRGESWRYADGHLFHMYRQFHDGVPVLDGELTVEIRNGFPPFAVGGLGYFRAQSGSGRPTLSEAQAIAGATAAVQERGGGSIKSSKSELVFSQGRLVYIVTLDTEAPRDTWDVTLDATTGDLRIVRSRIEVD